MGGGSETMAGRGWTWVVAAKLWLVLGGRARLHDLVMLIFRYFYVSNNYMINSCSKVNLASLINTCQFRVSFHSVRTAFFKSGLILKLFLFSLWTYQDFLLMTIQLKVIHQATYLIYLTTQSVHWRKLVCFSKLSALEGKLLSTLIFVIRFQIYLKQSQN